MALRPRSLLGQLVLLILAAFVAAQIISVWIFADERGAGIRAAQRLETAERTAAVVRAVESAPAPARDQILAAVNSRLVRFNLDAAPLVTVSSPDLEPIRARVLDLLPAARDLRVDEIIPRHGDGPYGDHRPPRGWMGNRLLAAGVAPAELRLSIGLDDGRWLNVASRFQRPGLQSPPALLRTTMLSLFLIMVALWWGLSRITNPLRKLAAAADGFGLDGPPPSMPQDGPREVRALSDALTRMHARLTGMIADRTRMLAALGHDLRSPITALRLRAEMVEDDETRERMGAILDEMQDMVEATLAFARGVSTDQPTEPTDLTGLLGELARELSETGAPVVLESSPPAIADLRRVPMRRALRNLLENAQRYGGGARLRLIAAGNRFKIEIDDDGPGIPEGELERVFDPFTRLETSRSRETGGIGLGLPIARAILRAHGGDVVLSNRPEGGLRATLWLPVAADRPVRQAP